MYLINFTWGMSLFEKQNLRMNIPTKNNLCYLNNICVSMVTSLNITIAIVIGIL